MVIRIKSRMAARVRVDSSNHIILGKFCMVKHNNELPNNHFRKQWMLRVKTWFDQPGQKNRRRQARLKKAVEVAPRPIDGLLRPAVRCPTVKYNTKLRLGRGFSLEELKLANVSKVEARNIGISVDHRRRNKSKESIAQNVERIKLYKSKVVVLGKKQKTADFEQLKGKLLPLVKAAPTDVSRKVVGESNAYKTLQKARLDKKYRGARLEKARKEAEEEANKKK